MNVIFGFIFILLIGFVASRLTLFQERFSPGMRNVMLAGTEFLFVGLFLGPHFTNIITEEALQQLAPVLSLGLGWIGLLIGLQFDRKIAKRISAPHWKAGIAISILTFSSVLAALYMLYAVLGLERWVNVSGYEHDKPWDFYVVLACAAAVSSNTALSLAKNVSETRSGLLKLIQLLNDLRTPAAIVIIGVWYSFNHVSTEMLMNDFIHTHGSGDIIAITKDTVSVFTAFWTNGFLWLTISTLLGVSLGWMLHYLTSERLNADAMLLVLTGSVILSGGVAAYLHLSPLFVNLVMGATLANLPNFATGRLSNLLLQTEKPFYIVFMILVGALWTPLTLSVVVTVCFYVILRITGLWFGAWTGLRLYLTGENVDRARLGFAMLPQGGLSIAILIGYRLIHPGELADFMLGVVLLSVLINQLLGPLAIQGAVPATQPAKNAVEL